MGIDEELFILRNGIPIHYIKFRGGYLSTYFEDNNIDIEKVELQDKDHSGYWIKGDDFLRMLFDIQDVIDNEYTRNRILEFFKENNVEPTDKVFYKLLF